MKSEAWGLIWVGLNEGPMSRLQLGKGSGETQEGRVGIGLVRRESGHQSVRLCSGYLRKGSRDFRAGL